MPRLPIIYTDQFPYHLTARSNNREWFYLKPEIVWLIMSDVALKVSIEHKFMVHAFVMMANHYHMVASCHQDIPLGIVMRDFQKSVSDKINKRANRTNHLWGGPYHASLITTDTYYARVIRYVYQNPVIAGVSDRAEAYKFSSLRTDRFALCTHVSGIANLVPAIDFESWINEPCSKSETEETRKGLLKSVFRPVIGRTY